MDAPLPPGIDLSKIPLRPHPQGLPSNFVDPPSQGVYTLGIGLALCIPCSVLVVLRIISNLKNSHRLFVDDYLSVAAFVGMTAYFGVLAKMSEVSRHVWDIPIATTDGAQLKTQFVSMLLTFCVGLPKIVILALYIRFFGVYMRFKYFALVCIAAVVIAYVSSVPLSFYLAYPRGGEAWSTDVVLRNLNAVKVYGMFNGIFALVADIMILLMPIPVLRKLKLAHSKKVRLYVVFAAGFLAVAFSLLSLVFRVRNLYLYDFTWEQGIFYACIVAEGYITIIVSCVPALYALWYNQVIKSSVYRSIKSAVSGFLNSSSSATEDVNFNRRNDIGSRKNLCPPTQQPNNAPERKSSVTANP